MAAIYCFQEDSQARFSLCLGHIVTDLLAGITLVDWLAIAPECPRGLSIVFPLLLVVTRLAQRFIPAT